MRRRFLIGEAGDFRRPDAGDLDTNEPPRANPLVQHEFSFNAG
jgi:hypothetical protein